MGTCEGELGVYRYRYVGTGIQGSNCKPWGRSWAQEGDSVAGRHAGLWCHVAM